MPDRRAHIARAERLLEGAVAHTVMEGVALAIAHAAVAVARHEVGLADREAGQDWRPLPEDVTTHCMWGQFEHGDRVCTYHHRLKAWTFDGVNECLRDGHPDPYQRTTSEDA